MVFFFFIFGGTRSHVRCKEFLFLIFVLWAILCPCQICLQDFRKGGSISGSGGKKKKSHKKEEWKRKWWMSKASADDTWNLNEPLLYGLVISILFLPPSSGRNQLRKQSLESVSQSVLSPCAGCSLVFSTQDWNRKEMKLLSLLRHFKSCGGKKPWILRKQRRL